MEGYAITVENFKHELVRYNLFSHSSALKESKRYVISDESTEQELVKGNRFSSHKCAERIRKGKHSLFGHEHGVNLG